MNMSYSQTVTEHLMNQIKSRRFHVTHNNESHFKYYLYYLSIESEYFLHNQLLVSQIMYWHLKLMNILSIKHITKPLGTLQNVICD